MCVKEAPLTRTTLLIPVKNEADAWQGFVRFYGPVIYRFARKQGIRDVGAADLMREVLRSAPEYDRGTIRDGLFTVTRDKIGSFLSKVRGIGNRGSRVRSLATLEADWDIEYERQLTVAAMNRVKPEFPQRMQRRLRCRAGVFARNSGQAFNGSLEPRSVSSMRQSRAGSRRAKHRKFP